METDNRQVGTGQRAFPRRDIILSLTRWACITFFGCAALNAQARLGLKDDDGQPVSDFSETGSRNLQIAGGLDSMNLRLFDIATQQAKEKVRERSFWRRIIPQIHVSGSFGVRDVVFIDPTSFEPYILPRDTYRLTVNLSLNEVFSFSKQTLAELELERLATERSRWLQQKSQLRASIQQQLLALEDQLVILHEELRIVQELLRFNQMRFDQGKIEFDSLMRTKLELLGTQKAIHKIQHQKAGLELKLLLGDHSEEQ